MSSVAIVISKDAQKQQKRTDMDLIVGGGFGFRFMCRSCDLLPTKPSASKLQAHELATSQTKNVASHLQLQKFCIWAK